MELPHDEDVTVSSGSFPSPHSKSQRNGLGIQRSFSDHSEPSNPNSSIDSDDSPSPNHPFYRIPTHPLILHHSVLTEDMKPLSAFEFWDADMVTSFIIEVMGVLPTTHNYFEGMHLCRTIFVKKYGLGRYMDNMALFWAIFHETYVGREFDPHSAYWSRWRHDRRIELEHIICHSPIFDDQVEGNYLEKYLDFVPSDLGRGSAEDQEFYKVFGEKVSKFEMGCLGVEKCNPEWNDGSVSGAGNDSRPSAVAEITGRVSSPRLSVDFAIPGLSCTPYGQRHSRVSFRNQVQQAPFFRNNLELKRTTRWEPRFSSKAFGIVAERRNKVSPESSISGPNSFTDRKFHKRISSGYHSDTTWEEAKNRFLPRSLSQRNRKSSVSAPMSVTRGPHVSMKLHTIAHPAQELSRSGHALLAIQESTTSLGRMTINSEFGASPVAYVGEPLSSVLPQCIQGSLYGQMEDILVDSVNIFLRSQASKVSYESVRRSLVHRRTISCVEPMAESKWVQTLLCRLPSISRKKRNSCAEDTRKYFDRQWGIVDGFKLLEANISMLEFYGPCAQPNPESPKRAIYMCTQLIQEAFSGNRTRFEDHTIIQHLEVVEIALSLLGNTAGLRVFRKRKYEALSLIRKGWKGSEASTPAATQGQIPNRREETQSDVPSRGIAIPRVTRLPPLRSSSLPRSTSISNTGSSTWGSTYWESEEKESVSSEMNSPCYGRGRKSAPISEYNEENENVLARAPGHALKNLEQNLNRVERKRSKSLQTLTGVKNNSDRNILPMEMPV